MSSFTDILWSLVCVQIQNTQLHMLASFPGSVYVQESGNEATNIAMCYIDSGYALEPNLVRRKTSTSHHTWVPSGFHSMFCHIFL